MNFIHKYGVHMIIIAIFGISLVIPLSSYGQLPVEQNSPVMKTDLRDCYYRWGDSPLDENGIPLWTYQSVSDPEWKLVRKYPNFGAERQGRSYLWFMIRVPEERWQFPALLIPPLIHDLDVYQGQKHIYRSGEFRPSKKSKYLVYKWHNVPLDRYAWNDTVFLRIYSASPRAIGVAEYSMLWIGHEMDLIGELIKTGISHMILGSLFILVGLFSLTLYLGRRKENHIVLSFSIFVMLIGISRLAGGPTSQLFINSPAIRYYMNFGSFFLFPIALYIFTEQILGRGYKSLIRRIWQIHIPVAILAIFLDIANIFPMSLAMFFLFGLLMLDILIAFPIGIIAAYRGNLEARMLVIGISCLMLSGMNDMLIAFRIIPAWRWLFQWGVFVFIIVLALIIERRFTRAHQQLREYSHTLEQKVEDRTQELSEKNVALEQAFQELRNTQIQMIMQSKMASLGNLVAGIAHEMNNPIGVIHSAVDTASRGVRKIVGLLRKENGSNKSSDNEDPMQKSFGLVERNHRVITLASERLAETVQGLKTFARLDEALFQQVDIHENIDTTLSLLYHELRDKVAIVKEYGEVPRIQCYPNELNQAFMNLFRNAIQAIDSHGTITVETYADETQICVKISDTGEGIPTDDLSQIFDPGFTTRGSGVGKGLGLSIVYNIIQKHRGNIEVDSRLGSGTTIALALPIHQ